MRSAVQQRLRDRTRHNYALAHARRSFRSHGGANELSSIKLHLLDRPSHLELMVLERYGSRTARRL